MIGNNWRKKPQCKICGKIYDQKYHASDCSYYRKDIYEFKPSVPPVTPEDADNKAYMIGYNHGFAGKPQDYTSVQLSRSDFYEMGYADGQGDAIAKFNIKQRTSPEGVLCWWGHDSKRDKSYFFEAAEHAIFWYNKRYAGDAS